MPQPPAPQPPKMGVSRPNRPGFRSVETKMPPVDVEKVDPETVFRAAAEARLPPRLTNDDILANAIPVDQKAVSDQYVANQAAAAQAQAAQAKTKAPEAATTADATKVLISDDLIDDLVREYGVDPEDLHEEVITFAQKKQKKEIKVGFRSPMYDDYVWAMAAVSKQIKDGNTAALEDATRNQLLSHHVSCRCLLQINGVWIWDRLKVTANIKAVNPNWNGDTSAGIPDFFLNTMASGVFELGRKIHPDFLFDFDKLVREVDALEKQEAKEEDEDAEDPENPTDAT